MPEHAYRLGSSAQLTGILTEASAQSRAIDAPTVLLLNSGLIHRVGPFRLHVDLARELSALGFSVFRFDLSGIGDSEKHKDSRPREEQILADIREAMDFLSTRSGAQKFVVMGLCTGADNAHKIAVKDERIVGAVFLDGYCYPTARFLYKKYLSMVFTPAVWWRLIKRFFVEQPPDDDNPSELHDSREDNYFWTLPPKQQTEAELKSLVNRGVHLLYIFSGGLDSINYRDQVADSFKSIKFGDQLQEEYFKESKHTYPILVDRIKMISAITSWMRSTFAETW